MELIATIALLAVIAMISFVAISGVIKSNNTRECETLKGNIESAARDYASDNRYDKSFINGIVKYETDIVKYETKINIQVLLNNNYLKGPIKNPYTMKNYSVKELEGIKIIIEFNNDYTVKSTKVDGIECG